MIPIAKIVAGKLVMDGAKYVNNGCGMGGIADSICGIVSGGGQTHMKGSPEFDDAVRKAKEKADSEKSIFDW